VLPLLLATHQSIQKVCEDADVDGIVQTACRGVWQNMGQNCAGPERFFVYEGCFQEFCDKVTYVVHDMSTLT